MRALVERYFAILNGADLAGLDAILADDATDHDALPGQPPGAAGIRHKIALYRVLLPTARSAIEAIEPVTGGLRVTWTTEATGLSGTRERETRRFVALFEGDGARLRACRLLSTGPAAKRA